MFQELIAHDAPKRHKLSVHVISTADGNGVEVSDGGGDAGNIQEPDVQTLDGMSVSPTLPQVKNTKEKFYLVFTQENLSAAKIHDFILADFSMWHNTPA